MLFQLEEFLDLPPQYNIAPGQDIFAVRGIVVREDNQPDNPTDPNAASFKKEAVPLQWGLIPFWSKDPTIGNKMINARSETVAEKPAFRKAFKTQRCLIPADGFYEWKKMDGGPKQPYYIQMKDERPFALAGIWDKWKDPNGVVIQTCSILTTEPNQVVKPIHKRMPVVINPNNFDPWLNPSYDDFDDLKALFKPYDAKLMTAYPVSLFVNSPNNKGEKCIEEFQQKFKQQKLFPD
jgi:putative SOS response-associated peptidase YedK